MNEYPNPEMYNSPDYTGMDYGIDMDEGFDSSMFAERQDPSYARALHAAPGAPAVDIYLDNLPVVRNLAYRGFSEYIRIEPGIHNIKVFTAGSMANPLINTSLNVPVSSIHTLALIGRAPNISLYPIEDTVFPRMPGMGYIRTVQLSPDLPLVDVKTANFPPLFRNIRYRDVTRYLPVRSRTYNFEVVPAGRNNVLLYVPNVRILPNRVYSLYIIGLASGRPSLQMLIPLDGSSYLTV